MSGVYGSEPWRSRYEARLQVWSEGFSAAWEWLAPRLARAEADADYWYWVANNPEEVRAAAVVLLASFDAVQARRETADWWAELDRVAAQRSAVGPC